MSKNKSQISADPLQAIKKLALSGLVVFAFSVYVVFERLTRPEFALSPASSSVAAAPAALAPIVAGQSAASFQGSAAGSTAATTGSYKNGTYQGQVVDAYYGLVQVQVNIQGGAIKDVQFLQYPSDRRTSRQINFIAMPYLKQEAIQAQSAQVDIVSGATLTSEGFVMSLESALQAAHN